jgi:hypothetical protein
MREVRKHRLDLVYARRDVEGHVDAVDATLLVDTHIFFVERHCRQCSEYRQGHEDLRYLFHVSRLTSVADRQIALAIEKSSSLSPLNRDRLCKQLIPN